MKSRDVLPKNVPGDGVGHVGVEWGGVGCSGSGGVGWGGSCRGGWGGSCRGGVGGVGHVGGWGGHAGVGWVM